MIALSLVFSKITQFFLGVDCGVHPPPRYDNFLPPSLQPPTQERVNRDRSFPRNGSDLLYEVRGL